MKFTFQIEVHIFEREELKDSLLEDNNPIYGIMGKDIVIPLRENKKYSMDIDCTEETKLKDIEDIIINKTNNNREFKVGKVTFLANGYRYYIGDESSKFLDIAEKYLKNKNEIEVQVLVCADAGSICFDDGLRYYMYSHEGNRHNEAHVHVENINHGEEASISIITGEIIEGNLSNKLLKKAKKKILSEQAFFINCWNTKTDGLEVDINKYFNLIKY